MTDQTFRFRFSPAYQLAALPFGVTPSRCVVTVGAGRLLARFGSWRVAFELNNIADVDVTGPYQFVKTAGPARLSLADRGLTFASNSDRGVFVSLRKPVPGIEPTGLIRHPNLTLTVADCYGLIQALALAAK
ncbi:hypothetical protein [Mycobacterium sp.]|uniref:hypothetical protein n=1 Tax=Mycobacterium sp. TaxID=1785 RepID=UPI003D1320F8